VPRLLLTGANGFVGKILTGRLKTAGYEVVALGGNVSPAPSMADEYLNCDIRDAGALAQAIASAQPTHIVHLAAISHVPTSFKEPLLTWQTNVIGSMNLLEAIRRHAPNAFTLFPSSSEVYGAAFKSGIAVSEDTLPQPLNPYAASKVAAEYAFREYFRQDLDGVIARPFNHIGAQQSPDFVTASFARQIALIEAGQQTPVLKVGNLDAIRDFLDVEDVCDAYIQLLDLAGQPGHPLCLNIASGRSRKIRDVLDLMLQQSHVPISVKQDPERLRPSDIPIAVGNNTLLKQTTGWQPAIALETTLSRLLDYWRDQVKTQP